MVAQEEGRRRGLPLRFIRNFPANIPQVLPDSKAYFFVQSQPGSSYCQNRNNCRAKAKRPSSLPNQGKILLRPYPAEYWGRQSRLLWGVASEKGPNTGRK